MSKKPNHKFKTEQKKILRTLKGVVVSDKMDKTIVVAVKTLKKHLRYKRRYVSTKRYKAHDEKNQCKVGNKVVIQECRPISKEKCWRVVKTI